MGQAAKDRVCPFTKEELIMHGHGDDQQMAWCFQVGDGGKARLERMLKNWSPAAPVLLPICRYIASAYPKNSQTQHYYR
jgi:hypothetical protein